MDLPLPTSLPEVEELIRALYRPDRLDEVSRIQEVLQRLQRSPGGWQLAQGLLENKDDNIKFFGALTLIVKLNTESSALSEDDARSLLANTIGWFLRFVNEGANAVVTRKVSSALVTYFIHFSHMWPNCVRHLLYCLQVGSPVPVEETEGASDTAQLVLHGSSDRAGLFRLQATMWFATMLVEEIGKTDMNSQKFINVHQRLMKNAPDVTALLSQGLVRSDYVRINIDSIKCFQSWVLYAQRSSSNPDILVSPLRELVAPAIDCLPREDLYEATIELFVDILSNYSMFFTEDHYNSIFSVFESEWARTRYLQLQIDGDYDFDALQFGMFMLAFGDAKVQKLIESTDERVQGFVRMLRGLLNAPGSPVGEDRIFVPALEFWSTFVETMTDTVYTDDAETSGSQPWMPMAMAHVDQVVAHCWKKIQFPSIQIFLGWDSSDRVGFTDARKDVADLLQSVFTLTGASLVSTFVDLTLQSLEKLDWAELEAAAFCLGSLSDCVSDDDSCDPLLNKVFGSSLFEVLHQGKKKLPTRLRQTGLSLIERYSDYFERHAEFLPSALTLLFDAVVDDAALAGSSARSIYTLCSSCRSRLTPQVGSFLGHYRTLYGSQVDSLAEERIVGAIASIIQAVPDEEQKTQAFQQLISCIKDDAESSLRLRLNPEVLDLSQPSFRRGLDPALQGQEPPSADGVSTQLAVRALRCLASIAKGMQAPSEGPFELDSNVSPALVSGNESLSRVQSEVITIMMRLLETFPANSDIVEAICNIFRAGFSETEPGPFVFPPRAISEFLMQLGSGSHRIGTFVSTACSFISSLSNRSRQEVTDVLSALLPWAIALLQGLQDPESDPELAQNGVDFVHRLMSKQPELLLLRQSRPTLEFFFLFALRVLDGHEPLPKAAVADFWTAFVTLKSTDPETQNAIAALMGHLGPHLAKSLMFNLGGKAARSELDKLADPLKKLVVAHPQAQAWLEAALTDRDFPSANVRQDDKMSFLKKIIGLRGARATNQVVRDFWLACRGSSFAYAS